MKRASMVRLATAAAAGVLLAAAPLARSQEAGPVDPLLTVSQDESSLEKQIYDYLRIVKEVPDGQIRYFDEQESDMLLLYTIPCQDAPELTVLVDTEVSERDEEGTVIERVINVMTVFELPEDLKTNEDRDMLLDLNNFYMREDWSPGCIFLDEAGDLVVRTAVNIPGPDAHVHAEMVYDAIARMQPFWEDYFPLLLETLGLVEPAP